MTGALDLFLPRDCVGCGARGCLWCARCGVLLAGPPRRAAAPAAPGLVVWVCGRYDGSPRRALLAYKERGTRALALPLGAALAGPLERLRAPGAVLVPVPSSRAARTRRGFGPVALLAAAAGGDAIPVRNLLAWTRPVHDQAALSRRQRAGNVSGALRCRRARLPAPAAVVLVDDVVTTGATLGEAARACRAAGVAVRGAVALLATRVL